MNFLSRTITIKYKDYISWVLVFLSLPVIVFFLGTLKPLIGILCSALWIFVSFLFLKEYSADKRSINCKVYSLIILLFLLALLTVVCGVGEFVWSDDDHKIRYAVLNDLISYKWPVIFDYSTQSNVAVKAMFGEGKAAFVYYYAYWMIPALIGKLFGLLVARVALVVWSVIGLFLICIGIGFISGKLLKRSIYVFVFFAGVDIIPFVLMSQFGDSEPLLELWNSPFIIHSHIAQLLNVFNQMIPCMLIATVAYISKSKKSLGFLGALMLCYSPWATIGFIPIALAIFFYSNEKNKFSFGEIKNILSVNNILPEILVVLTFGSFYAVNSSSTSIRGFVWQVFPVPFDELIFGYFLYIVVEFGLWMALVFKSSHKKPFYWIVVAELMVLPLYAVSEVNDLLLRGSLVPILYISFMVIEYISDIDFKNLRQISGNTLYTLALIVIVSFSGVLMLASSITSTVEGLEDRSRSVVSFGNIVDENEAEIVKRNYFAEDFEESFFFNYLAK